MTTRHVTLAQTILPTLRPCNPDDGPGYVGNVPAGGNVTEIIANLVAAGYEVSESRDDDGVRWVWVQ